jgi:ubiquinone/menaquinone biosynthesis C-methylase UbiE
VIDPHDQAVEAAFNTHEARFKQRVADNDVRLRAVMRAFEPLDSIRILDLGCGKGRFGSQLQRQGAQVVGLDLSTAMLAYAVDLPRVHGTARRLPFAADAFDGVMAIEVLEHLSDSGIDQALSEARRVLRPGGVVAIIDKNAGSLDARRRWLPSLAVKWIDERRGRWMYPAAGPVRERWFWPATLRGRLNRQFVDVSVEHLLSPGEAESRLFRTLPALRLLALWTAKAPGGADG